MTKKISTHGRRELVQAISERYRVSASDEKADPHCSADAHAETTTHKIEANTTLFALGVDRLVGYKSPYGVTPCIATIESLGRRTAQVITSGPSLSERAQIPCRALRGLSSGAAAKLD
jgi:hypothetical protein